MTFVLWEHLAQVIHPVGSEGEGLLVIGVVDPEAAVLRLHVGSHVPQQLLVLAEHLGGATDRDRVSRCRHNQAARWTAGGPRQFQGSSAASSVAL